MLAIDQVAAGAETQDEVAKPAKSADDRECKQHGWWVTPNV
jgi:hypothetical protein